MGFFSSKFPNIFAQWAPFNFLPLEPRSVLVFKNVQKPTFEGRNDMKTALFPGNEWERAKNVQGRTRQNSFTAAEPHRYALTM